MPPRFKWTARFLQQQSDRSMISSSVQNDISWLFSKIEMIKKENSELCQKSLTHILRSWANLKTLSPLRWTCLDFLKCFFSNVVKLDLVWRVFKMYHFLWSLSRKQISWIKTWQRQRVHSSSGCGMDLITSILSNDNLAGPPEGRLLCTLSSWRTEAYILRSTKVKWMHRQTCMIWMISKSELHRPLGSVEKAEGNPCVKMYMKINSSWSWRIYLFCCSV